VDGWLLAAGHTQQRGKGPRDVHQCLQAHSTTV
jgi:hypothetical protein